MSEQDERIKQLEQENARLAKECELWKQRGMDAGWVGALARVGEQRDQARAEVKELECKLRDCVAQNTAIDQLHENEKRRAEVAEAQLRAGGSCQCGQDDVCALVKRAEAAEAEVKKWKGRALVAEEDAVPPSVFEEMKRRAEAAEAEVERLKESILSNRAEWDRRLEKVLEEGQSIAEGAFTKGAVEQRDSMQKEVDEWKRRAEESEKHLRFLLDCDHRGTENCTCEQEARAHLGKRGE